MKTSKKLVITTICKNIIKQFVNVALLLRQLPQFFYLFIYLNFGQVSPQSRVGQLAFFGHIFRQYHCRNSFFLSPPSVTSFLSPLSYFFSEFRQWCCRNSFLSSFSQISLNRTYITNKLGFLHYSAKRLKKNCCVMYILVLY